MRLSMCRKMKEKTLKLSPRLQCIADHVKPGALLADVGTDHGYLPVWLLQNRRISRAIASDIKEGPLSRARSTAMSYGLANRISFRLCDGLSGIKPGEADTVVIAGMGGEVIDGIIKGADWLHSGETTLLLQPMTKAEVLRRSLSENGFRIKREKLVRDRGTIYAVIEAAPGKSLALTSAEVWCGVNLMQDALYGEYAMDRISKLETAVEGMRRGSAPNDKLIRTLEEDALALREKIKEWEHANGR